LILDNVDDSDLGLVGLPTLEAASAMDHLPRSELGSIIFTTTDGNVAKILAPQNTIELLEMTPDVA
jgi:hypothetical protein